MRVVPLGVAEVSRSRPPARGPAAVCALRRKSSRRTKIWRRSSRPGRRCPELAVDLYVTGPDDFGGELQRAAASSARDRRAGDVSRTSGLVLRGGAGAGPAGAARGFRPADARGDGGRLLRWWLRRRGTARARRAALTFPAGDCSGCAPRRRSLLADEGQRERVAQLGTGSRAPADAGIAARARPPTSIERCWSTDECEPGSRAGRGGWPCRRGAAANAASRSRSHQRRRALARSAAALRAERTLRSRPAHDRGARAAVRAVGNHHYDAGRLEERHSEIGSRVRKSTETVLLDAPPLEVKNVLYVPLRFFTDVLGAQANFDRHANTVTIVAQLVGRSAERDRSTPGAATSASARSPPSTSSPIRRRSRSVQRQRQRRFRSRPMRIDMEDVNANVTTPGELGDVRPGDFARVEMRKDGRVERVVDEYGSRNGHIVAVGRKSVRARRRPGHRGRANHRDRAQRQGGVVSDLRPATCHRALQRRDERSARGARQPRGRQRAAEPAAPASLASNSDADRPLRAGDTDSRHAARNAGRRGHLRYRLGRRRIKRCAKAPRASTPATTRFRAARTSSDVALIGRLTVGNAARRRRRRESRLRACRRESPTLRRTKARRSTRIVPRSTRPLRPMPLPVNPPSALLWINGRDVTSECVRTAQFIQYFRLTIRTARSRDRARRRQAGNTTTKSWTFTIRTR